jgi:hypothetical protein
MACVGALGVIWGSWFAALVAGSVYADISSDADAPLVPYLVWFLGLPLAGALTVAAGLAACGARCLDTRDRSRPT